MSELDLQGVARLFVWNCCYVMLVSIQMILRRWPVEVEQSLIYVMYPFHWRTYSGQHVSLVVRLNYHNHLQPQVQWDAREDGYLSVSTSSALPRTQVHRS